MNKIIIIESTDNVCLFYIHGKDQGFPIVALQIDVTLILVHDIFITMKEKELKEPKLFENDREKSTLHTSIK